MGLPYSQLRWRVAASQEGALSSAQELLNSAVSELSDKLAFEGKLVVHTSGTLPLSAVNSKNRRGVFYPLQTFSKNKKVDFKSVPICLESESDSDYTILENVAKSISDSIYKINSEQRKALHVAAVFANNFTNHLYAEALATADRVYKKRDHRNR